ncbi:unnamed protein product [Adineta steineri]|uniref:Antimicrobial peptide n=1 Tax=Adineta steineri TaxID=433720 RepID=A0A815I8U3_9BILA|nr:unnamed protein product [Adineta steineri]CAF4076082.1 unnamed protein product [Adineta steineri]
MKSLTIAITVVVAFIAVGVTVGYPSVTSDSDVHELPETRNFLQNLLINQVLNVLPSNIRDQVDDAAAMFSHTRTEFLVRGIKELQAYQAYSKIDFISAIQKIVKFTETEVSREQEDELKGIEVEAIQLATLLFENKLQPGALNGLYDLITKIVRKTIDGQTLVDELPKVVKSILAQHI